MTKETDRERIARQTEAFLSGGGQIEVVEIKRVFPDQPLWPLSLSKPNEFECQVTAVVIHAASESCDAE